MPSPGGLLSSCDINLYGASAGKVSALRVSGLSHPTAPIYTDGHGGGRATVFGRTLLNLPVTWSGVDIGDGSFTKNVSLDTDAGYAAVSVGFNAGPSTAFSGVIYPTITGLSADSNGVASVVHIKTGSAKPVASLIFNTANFISLYAESGAQFDSGQTDASSIVQVNANFPCGFASI